MTLYEHALRDTLAGIGDHGPHAPFGRSSATAYNYQEAQMDIDRSMAKRADYGEIWYLKALAALQAGDSAACCEALVKSLPKRMSDADLRLERDRLYSRQCR